VSIAELLAGKRVCVCCGSGGVGKTTTSAAIGLGLAAEGAKVAVVTIDPARRLANALGLEQLQNEPRRVDPARLQGVEVRGELWAMMLDPKRTFDELIDKVAPDRDRASQIKANRVYRELSTAVSGSQEFTAVAKLYDLEREGEFDVLVLDTPPSRSALDFLDAPGRLTSFLEGRALKAFMRPTGLGMRIVGRGAAPVLAALRRVTGVDLLADLSTFFALLGDMTEDFSRRARGVERMLKSSQTAFLLVTTSEHAPIDEAIWFRRTLEQSGLPFAGVVVNRVHHDMLGDAEPDHLDASLRQAIGPELARAVAANFDDYHVLARRDMHNIRRLETELDGRPLLLVPHLDDDVHDFDGLARVHRYLFASEADRARLIEELVA
jgi:anion-transporting  ArsA/GET3 family ATPase